MKGHSFLLTVGFFNKSAPGVKKPASWLYQEAG